jgi:DNA adenine methylase
MISKVSQTTYPRPFLKWAGGKGRLISQYQKYFPTNYQHYYEPFLGGGAVFFHLQAQNIFSQAVLTDINTDLITTYCCVRDHVDELIESLQKHKEKHHKNHGDYYYKIRSNSEGTDLQKAARFIYLNKTCFNGLYRVNSQGKFNVPLGRYKNPGICQEDVLRLASKALATANIENADFTTVLNYATSSDDFVFFDPPYQPLSETSNFTAYSKYLFGEKQQQQLRDVFAELAKRGVKVMLANSDCDFIRDLYRRFNIHAISAARSINSNANKRGNISEVLVTSY